MMIHEYNPCITTVQIACNCGCKKPRRARRSGRDSRQSRTNRAPIDIGKVNVGYPLTSKGFPERGNW